MMKTRTATLGLAVAFIAANGLAPAHALSAALHVEATSPAQAGGSEGPCR